MKTYSVSEVAIQLDANEETVRRWIREGKLKAQRAVGRGGHSIRLEDVVDFANLPPRAYLRSLEFWLTANKIRYIRLDRDKEVAVLSRNTGAVTKLSLGTLLMPGVGTGVLLSLMADEVRKSTRRKKQYPTYCIRLLADDEELVEFEEAADEPTEFSSELQRASVKKGADIPPEAFMNCLRELESKSKSVMDEKENAPAMVYSAPAESSQAKKSLDAEATDSNEVSPEPEKSRNFLDEIAQAKQLMDMGVLTPEEFADIKARLIAKI